MPTMTIRLSRSESAKVATLARKKKRSKSEVVRQAIAAFSDESDPSALDRLSGLVAAAEGLPKDLSTHQKHLRGLGKSRR